MYGVLGTANFKIKGSFRDTYWIVDPESPTGEYTLDPDAPGFEYYKIGLFLGNFFAVVRLSMGDTAIIGCAEFLEHVENYMFWIITLLGIVI